MPHQKINYPELVKYNGGHESGGFDFLTPTIEVHWMPEETATGGWVQLQAKVDYSDLKERLESSQTNEISLPIPPLDRGQINLLIRTLRRARDAAYGSDA